MTSLARLATWGQAVMNYTYFLGRILVSLVFIWGGVQKLLNIGVFAKLLADLNVFIPDEITPYLGSIPKYEALAWLLAGLELACGLMVLLGLAARWGALVLAVFMASTIIYIHRFWEMTGAESALHQTAALKNLSILGALLMIVAVGSSPRYFDRRPPL
jgi:putative oxidoreductase